MEITTSPAAGPALDAPAAAPEPGVHPHATEVASWMLEGRFFTVDTDGSITMWSPRAAEAFGWSRRDIVRSSFIDTVVADGGREEHAEQLRALLGTTGETNTFRIEADVVEATGGQMRVAFAAVRIHVGVGYEFNALLQEIASSSQAARSLEQLKAHGEAVLALIDGAVQGRHVEFAESDDARRLAGALIAFRVLERSAAPAAPDGEGEGILVPADVADALLEAQESRARAASAHARMEEAIAECEQLRAELAEANERAAADSKRNRATLARTREEAQAETQRLEAELVGTREGRGAEVERLLAELQGSRERADAAAERMSAELASAREQGDTSARELGETRSELERRDGELEAQRARNEALHAELRTLSAEAAEARVLAERASAERDASASRPAPPPPSAAQDEQTEAALAELAEARRNHARDEAEIETARARATAMETELAALADQAAEAHARADRTRSELDHAEAELAHARAVHEEGAASARAEADRLHGDLETERQAREEADRDAARLREQVVLLSADVERLTSDLAEARKTPAPTEQRVVRLAPRPAPATPKRRASQFLDFMLTADVPAEATPPPKPREPIAIEKLLEMAQEIDAKNPYTRRHSERVAGYAAALAEGLGFERPRIEAIRQAGLLHDVGKSEIPEAIVAKDDPLNLDELDDLARHSQIGHELLAAASEPELAVWVRHLHERFDGGGHPSGLAGNDIPEESRVLHAADALDHMTRPRAFRRNRPLREALRELEFCAGTRLDPNIATKLIELVERETIKVEGSAGPQRIGRPLGGPRGRNP